MFSIRAQSLSIDIYGGGINYVGDLKESYFNTDVIRPSFGLGFSYPVTNRLRLQMSYIHGRLYGDDKFNTDPTLFYRNLNFRTNIDELSLGVQLNLFDQSKIRYTPYIIAGLAYFHFDPFTIDAAGIKRELQPLGTEGQGVVPGAPPVYELNQFNIPFGGGFSMKLSERINLSLEILIRHTFTDYLDDVSSVYPNPILLTSPVARDLTFRGDEISPSPIFPTGIPIGAVRGNPARNDAYYTIGLKARVGLFSKNAGLGGRPPRSKSNVDCPKW